ncbi:hypothetical protein GCM10025868_26280 [Angustibacter aerolatus]|uniref:SLC26A/SulP transporter domain-containing protein n=1 Tax=Angustibacter aerolatus TaxID=1162965 RepID=A0ABQ6JIZ2_9ACTN|nr:hypothetical protein GCM10025868_26280 [Angustibacter aerolatus]
MPTPSLLRAARQPPTAHWRADAEASLVVFLVALPLSLGIALASGAPVAAGLIAAVVGGVVVGLAGGVPLQVSGPAAGLTVVVAEPGGRARVAHHVPDHGRGGHGAPAVRGEPRGPDGAGHQPGDRARHAGRDRCDHRARPGARAAGWQPALVGARQPARACRASLLQTPRLTAVVGVATIAVVVGWDRLPGRFKVVPAPLVAVAAVTLAALPLDVPRVSVPADLLDAVALPGLPDGEWLAVATGVVTVALIASVETLLSAVAVDRMHDGPRGDLDREPGRPGRRQRRERPARRAAGDRRDRAQHRRRAGRRADPRLGRAARGLGRGLRAAADLARAGSSRCRCSRACSS